MPFLTALISVNNIQGLEEDPNDLSELIKDIQDFDADLDIDRADLDELMAEGDMDDRLYLDRFHMGDRLHMGDRFSIDDFEEDDSDRSPDFTMDDFLED